MTIFLFQNLPLNERSPEDRLLIGLAKVDHFLNISLSKSEMKYSNIRKRNGADAQPVAYVLSHVQIGAAFFDGGTVDLGYDRTYRWL